MLVSLTSPKISSSNQVFSFKMVLLRMLMTSMFLYTMKKSDKPKPSLKRAKSLWATQNPVLSESLVSGVLVLELVSSKSKSSNPGRSFSRPVLYLP
jgi:hypothetical protein